MALSLVLDAFRKQANQQQQRGNAAPQTGRRHQIRAHLTSLGHPVACDRLYGDEEIIHYRPDGASINKPLLKRPGLHAKMLELVNPATGKRKAFEAPTPSDLQLTMEVLGDLSG